MKTLRVGMRVRITSVGNKPHQFLGMVGVIIQATSDIWDGAKYTSGFLLDISNMFEGNCDGASGWGFYAHQLEPISDSNTIVSWSDCAWRPEGVTA